MKPTNRAPSSPSGRQVEQPTRLQQTGRIHIQKQRRLRLLAQDGSRTGALDRTGQGFTDSLRLALFGRDAEHPFGRTEHWDCERESVLRHRCEIWKMTF